ncbi:MAG: hypothetical protein CVU05_02700 [Bacteroidetes bacterium HGW-Bacteroidetes-21]|jgi:hypothetical protein|nr:MAG: hypothetical protein CVU05_02700 [Bacteroidetes bacterium HGW-Bacteroidetes-21]
MDTDENEKQNFKKFKYFIIEADHYKEQVCEYGKAFKIYSQLKEIFLYSNKSITIELKARNTKSNKWTVLASVVIEPLFFKTTVIGFKQNTIPDTLNNH